MAFQLQLELFSNTKGPKLRKWKWLVCCNHFHFRNTWSIYCEKNSNWILQFSPSPSPPLLLPLPWVPPYWGPKASSYGPSWCPPSVAPISYPLTLEGEAADGPHNFRDSPTEPREQGHLLHTPTLHTLAYHLISSQSVCHIEPRHGSLLVFRSRVHQISRCRWWIVDADPLVDLVRHCIIEKLLRFKWKVAFFTRMEKLLMFEKCVFLFPPLISCKVFTLTSDEATMWSSMIHWADWLFPSVHLHHLLFACQAGAAVHHPSHSWPVARHLSCRASLARIALSFSTQVFLTLSWIH